MPKRHKCATCNTALEKQNYLTVFDEKSGKTIKVCRDNFGCRKPYVVVENKKAALAGGVSVKTEQSK